MVHTALRANGFVEMRVARDGDEVLLVILDHLCESSTINGHRFSRNRWFPPVHSQYVRRELVVSRVPPRSLVPKKCCGW